MKTFKISLLGVVMACVVAGIASAKIPYENPAGDKFPIVAWYAFSNRNQITHKRFKDLDEAGFTHIHSSLMNDTSCYRTAINAMKGTGIKAIVSSMMPYYSTLHPWENIPEISMWCMGDEPSVGMFEHYKRDKDRFEHFDSKRMVYINFYPSYAGPVKIGESFYSYLNDAAQIMDLSFISYDHYPFVQHYYEETGWTSVKRPFYQDLQDARKASKDNHIPFWAFCMSSGHHANSSNYIDRYINPTKEELSVEAYSALAYGAQGLQYFRIAAIDGGEVYPDPPVDADGNTNNVWEYIKAINLRIQKLAPVFLGNDVSGVWHNDTVSNGLELLKVVPAPFTKIEGTPGKLLISKFMTKGHNYLMILNKDMQYAQKVKLLRGSQVKRVTDDGVVVRDNHSTFIIPPADFLLFTWI